MPLLAVFSAEHCGAEEVVDRCARQLGYEVFDPAVLAAAAESAGVDSAAVGRAMHGPPFVFNRFSHKRERLLAHLRLALAEALERETGVLHGFLAHLMPRSISHVLRVCLLADLEHRVARLMAEQGASEREARRLVRESDRVRAEWTQLLFDRQPWDRELYDLKIPLHSTAPDAAVAMIADNAAAEVLQPTAASRRAVADFQLAARAEVALAERGHYHTVTCQAGQVRVIIDEFVMRLDHLKRELADIVRDQTDAERVAVETGPGYRPSSMVANVDLSLPQKVLLVDDERDFVLTLSERLQMRDLQPAIANDGEQALSMLRDEAPEVMILDLKMPGIDGIEVLRRVKAEHPEVEVIILTGHGSKRDREICLGLGAFAYLEKPVDIEELAGAMKRANEKICARDRTDDAEDESAS